MFVNINLRLALWIIPGFSDEGTSKRDLRHGFMLMAETLPALARFNSSANIPAKADYSVNVNNKPIKPSQ